MEQRPFKLVCHALLLVGLLVALVFPASLARADDAARAQAAEHFKRGVKRGAEHDYSAALLEFQAAYRLIENVVTLYNIALAQVELGQTTEAMVTLHHYLDASDCTQNPKKCQAAQALLVQLTAKQPAAPRRTALAGQAQLTVVVFPYGSVWIDDQLAGESPVAKDVSVGVHHIGGGREHPELSIDVVLQPGVPSRVVLPWNRADLAPASPAAGVPAAASAAGAAR